MRSFPLITHSMPEEIPIGSNVITILAQDPVTMSPITKFRVKSLPRQFAMDPIGNIVVTERIDYETIPFKVLLFECGSKHSYASNMMNCKKIWRDQRSIHGDCC